MFTIDFLLPMHLLFNRGVFFLNVFLFFSSILLVLVILRSFISHSNWSPCWASRTFKQLVHRRLARPNKPQKQQCYGRTHVLVYFFIPPNCVSLKLNHGAIFGSLVDFSLIEWMILKITRYCWGDSREGTRCRWNEFGKGTKE